MELIFKTACISISTKWKVPPLNFNYFINMRNGESVMQSSIKNIDQVGTKRKLSISITFGMGLNW